MPSTISLVPSTRISTSHAPTRLSVSHYIYLSIYLSIYLFPSLSLSFFFSRREPYSRQVLIRVISNSLHRSSIDILFPLYRIVPMNLASIPPLQRLGPSVSISLLLCVCVFTKCRIDCGPHDHPPPRARAIFTHNIFRHNNRSRAIAHVRSNRQPEAASIAERTDSSSMRRARTLFLLSRHSHRLFPLCNIYPLSRFTYNGKSLRYFAWKRSALS